MDCFEKRIVYIRYIVGLLISMNDSQFKVIKAVIENMI